MSGDLETQREREHRAVRRTAYTLLIQVVTVLAAAATSIFVSVTLTQRSERKLCAVVINVDDGYHRSPPVTDPGKTQAANYARLRRELGCPPYEGN